MSETTGYVDELLALYGSPQACAAELLCDRHDPAAVAFTVIDPDLTSVDLTYGELRRRSEQGAAALAGLGVGAGDAVATLMGKSADLVVTLLSIWRLGAVHVPLFTAFAWPAIELRLTASAAKVVVTDANQRAKLEATDATVVVAGGSPSVAADLALTALLDAQQTNHPAAVVGGDAPLVMIFTSGTTGTPKGVPVPVRALASFRAYVELGLDVTADDVFWNAADPGWAYGLYYAILGPLAAGRRSLILHAGFSPELSFAVLQTFGVTNFAAAPTVYRAMRAKPESAPAGLRLRRASSAGEPLTPEVIDWAREVLGTEVRDHYGQTEHGMVVVNAWHGDVRRPLRRGSMGHPLPGWSAAVLADDGFEPAPAGTMGRVAIDAAASPLMWFRGYHDAPEKTAERFSPDRRWYLTGDAGSIDADGHYYFSSRDDDVIIMAGYRIGPFDVESVLATHPDVVESAVIGVPDQIRGEVLEAFVVLRDGVAGDDELVAELQRWVKDKFAAHAFPRSLHFVDALPKTPSGKVQRFVLRAERAGAR
ncbi:AMP-binding protein [Speluncibacter jeojiensis]|uniref:AMP-binding protein n=1 Tax=Speluncibacter jeojiensis TaxID=2710754 RepID=A0A9X4REY6_9ACTN|nr:AMP-binding protein [Corynebacteriales bacterium D3-21]